MTVVPASLACRIKWTSALQGLVHTQWGLAVIINIFLTVMSPSDGLKDNKDDPFLDLVEAATTTNKPHVHLCKPRRKAVVYKGWDGNP